MANKPKDEHPKQEDTVSAGGTQGNTPDAPGGGDSPWKSDPDSDADMKSEGPETSQEPGPDTVESIEPEPVPRPEDSAPKEPTRPEPELKKGGGWFKPVFYLVLILIVVGGPVGLLAWNPVIQPNINEISGLGLPKVYPFGQDPADPAVAALADRVTALENAPAPEAPAPAIPAALQESVAALDRAIGDVAGRLEALEGRVTELAARPAPEPAPQPAGGVDPAALADLEERLGDRITTALTDIESLDADLAALRAEVRALEAIPAAASDGATATGVSAAQLGAVSARIDGLEQRLRDLPDDPAPALERLDGQLADLQGALADLSAAPSVAPADLEALSLALGERIDGVRNTLIETRQALNEALDEALNEAQAALGGRIDAVQANLDANIQLGADANRADQAFVLAVSQFAGAVRNGRSFAAEVAALGALGAEIDSSVAFYAEDGIATIPELRLDFAPIARAVVRRSIAGEEESVVGEALNRIADLVSVRRTGVVEGEAADAIVARAEAALAEDDVATALSALSELPEELRLVAQPWLNRAGAKVNAEVEIARLQSAAADRIRATDGAPGDSPDRNGEDG
ncbi:MAG: hypothetical protein NXI16_17690 [Alphaproteobacteria bacterium]|nr:hypothetical protein [Alphaproteobacteria bacterium]